MDPAGVLGPSSEITAGAGDNDILAAPTYDAAGHQLSSSATTAGAQTKSTFTVNPRDEIVAEVRPEGNPLSAVNWTKTNFDPAGNATDRCVWNTDPGSEPCKPVGQTFTTTPSVHATTASDARNQRISLAILRCARRPLTRPTTIRSPRSTSRPGPARSTRRSLPTVVGLDVTEHRRLRPYGGSTCDDGVDSRRERWIRLFERDRSD